MINRIIEEDGTEILLHKTDNVVAVIIDGVTSSFWALCDNQVNALRSARSLDDVYNVVMA